MEHIALPLIVRDILYTYVMDLSEWNMTCPKSNYEMLVSLPRKILKSPNH
jgi:hypothetical protein